MRTQARDTRSYLKYVGATDESRMLLPVDPPLRAGFWTSPINERPTEELLTWRSEPFVCTFKGGFTVHCLDGGAWDRPTSYGICSTIPEARLLALARLTQWHAVQSIPIITIGGDRQIHLVRLPRHPGDEEKRYGSYASLEAATAEVEKYRFSAGLAEKAL